MFIHFSLVIIIITETQMDARATYCWMPFETHVSINVDMCFQRSLLFLSATFASLSLHLDLYDYNGSRFKTFWQTSESLDSVVCSVYKNNTEHTHPLHTHRVSIIISYGVLLSSERGRVVKCTRQTCSKSNNHKKHMRYAKGYISECTFTGNVTLFLRFSL